MNEQEGDRHLQFEIEPVDIDPDGLFDGGLFILFAFSRRRTGCWWAHFEHGEKRISDLIAVWDCILTDEKCLEFCQKILKTMKELEVKP